MQPDLTLDAPLSQVVFVHDYIQLVFQDAAFSIFNTATYTQGTDTIQQGELGFCDALVALIDREAEIDLQVDSSLVFRFAGDARLSVPSSGSGVRGPEAWTFSRVGASSVVAQNV